MKIIAIDFGGVLDKKDSYLIQGNTLEERSIRQTDPDKAFFFVKFIVDNNLTFFVISDLSKHVDIWHTLIMSLKRSSKEEHLRLFNLVDENRRKIIRLQKFSRGNSKQEKINNMIKLNNEYEVIAIEDEYELNNCKQVWVGKEDLFDENKINELKNMID